MATVLSIKEAAPILEVCEQAVREMIKAGVVGKVYKAKDGKAKNNTYYITLEMIENMQKGARE